MRYDDEPDQETLNRWHQDPDNWKWGVFYYNKEDKRLLVLKRSMWMGLTFNYAHPLAIPVTLSIFLMIIVLAKFS